MAINKGMAKAIIFVSGDQHWGEIMAKEMPQIKNVPSCYGRPQMLYEITASGIFQDWKTDVPNSNRFQPDVHKGIKSFSNLTTTCSGSSFHTCTSKAHYGMISVDFETKSVRAGIKTPADGNEEAYIEFSYSSAKDCKRLLLYPSILMNLLVLL